MTRKQLIQNIRDKQSMLCVGLDTDLSRIPAHLSAQPDPVFAFNKAIIDATQDVTVAYKINTAFYESQGVQGWESLQRTIEYIPHTIFSIADAKRGDIGNTAEQYARTFYHTYPFDSVTVAPYMGEDSVKPFLNDEGKWAIVLGLTSNKGSQDIQMIKTDDGAFVYEKTMAAAASWGSIENTMFVVGATQKEQLHHVRTLFPAHFFLIPGVGAQGGDVDTVCESAMNTDVGILINVSRGVIYAGGGQGFATAAGKAAKEYQQKMARHLR